MASDWMVQRVQGTAPAVKPTVAPVVPQQVPVTKTPVAPVKTPTTDKWTSPQGKFMTGNLIQKAFDIPQVFNYGFAGFQKAGLDEKKRQIATRETESKGYLENIGKRFVAGAKGILPGVQNRTMVGAEEGNVDIGGELGIKNKYAKGAYNFGVNMAIPSLAVSKIPGVKQGANLIAKGVSKGADVVRKIEPVAKALEKVPGLEYFRNPAAGKIIQGATDTTGRRVSGLFNVISDTAKGLKPDELEEVGRIIEGKGTTTNVALITRANYIRDISNKIGQELVDTGIMSAETLAKYQNQGGYLAHIADQVRNLERSGQRGSSVLKFATTSLKERKGKLGGAGQPDYIRQFQFPTFKSLGGEITTLESTKAIKDLATKFGTTGQKFMKSVGGPRTTAEGLVKLADIIPDAKISRLFKGVALPKEVAEYVARKYSKTDPKILDQIANKALSYWKAGKTILNPAYHVRNLLSNQILSDMSTGRGLVATVADYGEAVNAYRGKGSPEMMQYLQELKDIGTIGRQSLAGGVEKMNPKTFTKGKSLLGKAAEAPFKLQNMSEETSKLNVYSFWRRKGLDIQEAAKKAEEAIFSPYNISRAERDITKGTIPFYSFARQALPFTAKTLVKNPERLTKYSKIKTGVESLSPEGTKNNKNLPESQRGGIRLPIKDKYGNYVYADPTYLYPFGNFQEAGFSKGQLPFGFGLNPLITEAASQAFNKDLYFDQPIAKSNIPEKSTAQRVSHAARTFLPTVFSTAGQLKSAFTNQPDYAGRTRSRVQAVLNAIGLKSATFDPANQTKWDSIDKNAKIKSIENEIRSIMSNQSIPQKEKTDSVKRLQEIKIEILRAK